MTIDKETGSLLRSLLTAYAVHGGDAAGSLDLARELDRAEVVAWSVAYLRHGGTNYRIVTLADGARYLAVKRQRRGRPVRYLPVFSVARFEALVADGWAP